VASARLHQIEGCQPTPEDGSIGRAKRDARREVRRLPIPLALKARIIFLYFDDPVSQLIEIYLEYQPLVSKYAKYRRM
jgi:hypothetical protein